MNADLNVTEIYRKNASELRSVAQAVRDRALKRALLASASDYERWAREQERTGPSAIYVGRRYLPHGLCGKAVKASP